MSDKAGNKDVRDVKVTDLVGNFPNIHKNVEGVEFLSEAASRGYMYMTDGGKEIKDYTTMLREDDRCPTRTDGGTDVEDASSGKGGNEKNG